MPPLDFLCDDLITVQGTPKFKISDKVFDLISFVNEKKKKRKCKNSENVSFAIIL